MKKIGLGLAVITVGMFLFTGSASAFVDFSGWTLYSELYDWYDSDGTKVYGTGELIGDTSGVVKVEVKEERWENPANANEVVFSYTIFNACYALPTETITSYRIRHNSFLAKDYLAPTGWTFDDSGIYWEWSTTGTGIPHAGSLNYMQVHLDNYAGWGLNKGDVDISGVYSGNNNWYASGPVPEPTSLLLLGSGLLGLAAFARKRRRKV